MTPATTFAGKTVALFGLGGSGLATARSLIAGGARVITWDDNAASVEKAAAEGIGTQDLRMLDWTGIDSFVLSPGVPLTHPTPHWTVDLARGAGIEIIGDIEVFSRERRALDPQAPLVAITGTNGKSTTTALIAHLLRQAGREVALGGNIGTAILSLPAPSPARVHVVECSSFQIDLAPSLAPSVGLLLNLTPDHLDRHGTMENYAAIKERLVAASDTAIVGVDDGICAAVADRIEAAGGRVTRISARRPLADGVYAETDELVAASGGRGEAVASLSGIGALRGRHNAQNAAAAFAALVALGLENTTIAQGLASFPGLPHRMEEVGTMGPVLFVNDSKATNAEAAAPALSSFESVYWIAGGKPKEGGIKPLKGFFTKIRKAYLIGEAAEDFAQTLQSVPHVLVGTLEHAVALAAKDAEASADPAPVVLLSPACASYDQFKSFEHRGDVFRDLVRALEGVTPRGSGKP